MSSVLWSEVLNFNDIGENGKKNLAPREEDYKNTSWIQYPWNHGKKIPLAKNADEILNYLKTEFGDFIFKGSKKTNHYIDKTNPQPDLLDTVRNWFLDQKLVSKRIGQWVRRNGNGLVEYGEKPNEQNRYNRGKAWNFDKTWNEENKQSNSKVMTLHLPHATYFTGNWNKLRGVIKRLVNNYDDLKYCDDYRLGFVELFRQQFGAEVKSRRMSRSVEEDNFEENSDNRIDFDDLLSKGFVKLH